MYDVLKVTFKNGNSVCYHKNEWNDWAFTHGFIVVKNNGAWVAMYNASDVFAVELLKESEDL